MSDRIAVLKFGATRARALGGRRADRPGRSRRRGPRRWGHLDRQPTRGCDRVRPE